MCKNPPKYTFEIGIFVHVLAHCARTPTESSILPSKSETEKPISIDKDATIMKVMTQYLHMPRNEFGMYVNHK